MPREKEFFKTQADVDAYDASTPLPLRKHEEFIQMVASGVSRSIAYSKVYGVPFNSAKASAWQIVNSATLRSYAAAKRLMWLRQQIAIQTSLSREHLLKWLEEIIVGNIAEIDEHDNRCQELTLVEKTVRVAAAKAAVASGKKKPASVILKTTTKCVNKLDAARLYCEITGYKAGDKLAVQHTINPAVNEALDELLGGN